MWKPSRLALGKHVFPIATHSSTGAFTSQKRAVVTPGIGLPLQAVWHWTDL